jgi:hypothetical protein
MCGRRLRRDKDAGGGGGGRVSSCDDGARAAAAASTTTTTSVSTSASVLATLDLSGAISLHAPPMVREEEEEIEERLCTSLEAVCKQPYLLSHRRPYCCLIIRTLLPTLGAASTVSAFQNCSQKLPFEFKLKKVKLKKRLQLGMAVARAR